MTVSSGASAGPRHPPDCRGTTRLPQLPRPRRARPGRASRHLALPQPAPDGLPLRAGCDARAAERQHSGRRPAAAPPCDARRFTVTTCPWPVFSSATLLHSFALLVLRSERGERVPHTILLPEHDWRGLRVDPRRHGDGRRR